MFSAPRTHDPKRGGLLGTYLRVAPFPTVAVGAIKKTPMSGVQLAQAQVPAGGAGASVLLGRGLPAEALRPSDRAQLERAADTAIAWAEYYANIGIERGVPNEVVEEQLRFADQALALIDEYDRLKRLQEFKARPGPR